MNRFKTHSALFFFPLLVMGCYYDNEIELYGVNDCVTTNISYVNDVQPMLEQNCYVCHSTAANLGNVTLEGYSATKMFVDNMRLIGAITHMSGFSQMPQNAPKLPECTLDKIQAWVNDGAPNN